MAKNLLKKTAFTVAFIFAIFFSNAQVSVNGGADQSICNGGASTIGGFASGGTGPYTYSWTPSTGLSSTTSVTPTASPTITTQYTVTATDALSATATDVVVVTVWPTTSASPTSNSPVCVGGTINFLCNPTGGATTYTWTGPNSFMSNAQNPIIPLATSAASGTYTVNIANGGGCAAMNTTSVFVPATPTVTIAGGTTICAGNTTTLAAAGASTYSWTTSATTPSIAVSPPITTTYSVIGTTSGCNDTVSVTVVVNALPSVIVNSSTICIGSSDILSAAGANTYSWAPPTDLSSTVGSNVTTTATITTIYTVTGTDINGCMNSATSTVTVNPLPSLTTSWSGIPCYGMCVGSDSAVCATAVSWAWLPGGETTPAIHNLCAGTYTVTVTDANGCTSTASTPLNQPPALNAGFTLIVNATCAGQSNGSVDAAPTGGTPGYFFAWSNGATSQSNSGLGAGNYTLTVTDASSCSATNTLTISNATAAPTATITGVSSSCQGQPITFTGVGSGGAAPYSYNWIDKQLAASVGTNTICTVSPTTCGYDTITFQVIDYNGCVGDTTQAIFINYSDSISGYVVDNSGAAVGAGSVYLFQDKSSHVGLGDTIAVTNIHPNGYYQFPNVFYGDYRIKFIADTTIYHTAIPNYYSTKPNAFQWDSAVVIHHNTCTATNIGGYNDTLIQLPASTTGPGNISGYVTPGAGYGQRLGHNSTLGAPLKGVDIKLGKNPGGNAAARTSTDVNGYYSFTNVPIGNYRIFVDIPNYGMDSVLVVSITPTVTTSSNNNYYVDSTMIRVDTAFGIGIKTNASVNNNTLFVYPNPATNFVTVKSAKELGTIVLINSLGQTVYKESTSNIQQCIDIGHLPAGIYVLHVQDKFVRLIKE
jgi:hypothetical protein